MKPNAKGKTAYDLVTDADAKAALRSRPFIFFLSDRRTNKNNKPPVYLHLIFETSSVTRFFFNFEIPSLKNQHRQ